VHSLYDQLKPSQLAKMILVVAIWNSVPINDAIIRIFSNLWINELAAGNLQTSDDGKHCLRFTDARGPG